MAAVKPPSTTSRQQQGGSGVDGRKVDIGQAPVDYLVSWRISLAQKRLREGKPIAWIAKEVGYESPSALARAFRRKTGVSPRQWRG